MTPLQKAAQALLTAATEEEWYAGYAGLRKALDIELAQSVEPVAWIVYVAEVQNQYVVDDIDDAQLVDDCTNHGAEVTPLYLHPPQQATVSELLDVLRTVLSESYDGPLHQSYRDQANKVITKASGVN